MVGKTQSPLLVEPLIDLLRFEKHILGGDTAFMKKVFKAIGQLGGKADAAVLARRPVVLGFHLSNVWGESLDYANHVSSLNGFQAVIGPDGVRRYVIAHRDPGVPNWLDLAGHHRAFAHFRAVWCAQAFAPTTTVVAVDDLRTHLPAAHPVVTPAQRRTELEQRRIDVSSRHQR